MIKIQKERKRTHRKPSAQESWSPLEIILLI